MPVFPTLALRMALAALAAALTGCASLTPEQCRQADWRQIGYADAVRGASGAQIDEHAKACAPLGIRPDLDAYLQGRAQGLTTYCQRENGFQVGRRGDGHIAAECPDSLRGAFLFHYDRGRQVHAIESELAARRSESNGIRSQLRRIDTRVAAIRSELAKKDLAAERRKALLDEYQRNLAHKDDHMRDLRRLDAGAEGLEIRLRHTLREFGH